MNSRVPMAVLAVVLAGDGSWEYVDRSGRTVTAWP